MKEELTREVLEEMTKCSTTHDCVGKCAAFVFCSGKRWPYRGALLATALLEEMDKPKVWDGAPEDAPQAQITWITKNGGFTGIKTYTRELPKTRARQIAEEVTALVNRAIDGISVEEIESVLNKYAEELKGGA